MGYSSLGVCFFFTRKRVTLDYNFKSTIEVYYSRSNSGVCCMSKEIERGNGPGKKGEQGD